MITAPKIWHRWNEQLGLLNGPILACLGAWGAFYLLRRYGLAFRSEAIARIFAAKLTFLSLILAAGFIQYNYFFHMRWVVGQKLRAGDWPHIKQLRQLLDDARASGRTNAPFLEWRENTERRLREEPERTLRELAAWNRPLFRISFSVLFALGGLCFASAAADLWLLLAPSDVAWIRYRTDGFGVCGLSGRASTHIPEAPRRVDSILRLLAHTPKETG
jgi:hypothetical protein